MTDLDVPGPIDFVLIEFPGDAVGNELAKEVGDLIDRGTVRLYDVAVVRKGADGSSTVVDLTDPSLAAAEELQRFAGAQSGLLGDQDIADAVAIMDAGSVALMLVYENTWAIPFIKAAVDQGGQVIATERIGFQDIIDALDAADAADAAN